MSPELQPGQDWLCRAYLDPEQEEDVGEPHVRFGAKGLGFKVLGLRVTPSESCDSYRVLLFVAVGVTKISGAKGPVW